MFGRFVSRPSSAVPASPEKPCQPAFDQILDACLLEIQTHRKSLADCLRKYPSCADELRSLLTIALEIQAVPIVSPSVGFGQGVRLQFLEPSKDPVDLPFAGPRRKWKAALFGFALMAVILFSGWETVAASANTLPGHPLYLVKRWTESIEVLFSSDARIRTMRHAEFARRRLDEAKALASHGEDELANQTISDYEDEINCANESLKADQQNRPLGTARVLREQLIGELEELRAFQPQVPAASVPAVKHAETAMTKVIDQLDLPSGN